MPLFNRKIKVTVGTRAVEGLRMSFSVKRTSDSEPDTAVVTLWGTSEEIRDVAQKEGTPLDIEAGYDDNFGLLFKGNVRRTFFAVSGPDTTLRIEAGDGDQALGSTLQQQTFPKDVSVESIINDMVDKLGVSADDAKRKLKKLIADKTKAGKPKRKGFSVSGLVKDTLAAVLGDLDINFSIQDGTLIVADKDAPSENFPTAVSLSPTTGLVGTPEQGEDGALSITSLLQPGIRPHRQLEVKAKSIQGFYVTDKVEHRGDTYVNDWYSVAEAKEFK